MTNTALQQWQETFEEALRPSRFSVRRRGPALWTFQISGRTRRRGTVAVDDEWLRFTLPLLTAVPRGAGGPDLCRLLELNGALPPAAKFVVDPRRPRVLLAAEVPLEKDALPERLAPRVHEILCGFEDAIERYESDAADVRQNSGCQPGDATADAAEDEGRLAQLCRESGWPFVERSSGRVAVELEVPGDFCQAFIETSPQGGLRVRVDFPQLESLSETVRRSVALLLLTASGIVRFARAAVTSQVGLPAYRWEVVFDEILGPDELSGALCALSTACRVCVREFQSLEDDSLSQQYLAMRGWSS